MKDWENKYFFTRLVWLFPLAFVFHVMEESNGFAYWVTNVLKGEMDVRVFYVNNAMFMLVLLGLTTLAYKKQNQLFTFLLFLWVTGQQFWNFVFHIYTQFQFNAYSPGYFTAIFLYFPIFLYLSYLAIRDNHLLFRHWLICFFIGFWGIAFTIWSGLYHFGKFPLDKWF